MAAVISCLKRWRFLSVHAKPEWAEQHWTNSQHPDHGLLAFILAHGGPLAPRGKYTEIIVFIFLIVYMPCLEICSQSRKCFPSCDLPITNVSVFCSKLDVINKHRSQIAHLWSGTKMICVFQEMKLIWKWKMGCAFEFCILIHSAAITCLHKLQNKQIESTCV